VIRLLGHRDNVDLFDLEGNMSGERDRKGGGGHMSEIGLMNAIQS
jgi:hypothetical protein